MFTVTPSIQKSVGIINSLDEKKFPALLSRVLQKIHSKTEKAFTEDEETKLQSTLQLSTYQDLQLLLETLSFIFEQAAYHLAKPSVLVQQLQTLGLEEDKVNMIAEAWANGAKSVVSKLKQSSVVPQRLESVDWDLSLKLAETSRTKEKEPIATYHLGIAGDEKKEQVHVEFTHEELYEFYNKLEAIQAQLDSVR